MLEVWWIRHGETEWNLAQRWQGHSDVALSAVGEGQAVRLARAFQDVTFDAVYTSDLRRAVETCRLSMPGVSSIPDSRLREVDFGHFEGLAHEDMSPEQQAALAQWLGNPFEEAIPGGESLAQVARRVDTWFQELPRSGRIAVFTHGGVIRCSLWTATASPGARLALKNCSTTCIRYGERAEVQWINDCSYI